VIYSLNVIRIGSHYSEVSFSYGKSFLVRTHIQLPNSLVQKWGREYISMYNFTQAEIDEMANNHDESRFFPICGEMLYDRHEVPYIKASKRKSSPSKYWITTFRGMDYMIHKNSLLPVSPDSISRIFSIAFNRSDPQIFEATAIVQAGDIIRMGNSISVFCPEKNPFLKVWHTLTETTLPAV